MKREIECLHKKPISQCLDCWPDFCFETDYTVEQRAIKWLLGDDTGMSSKALCAHMLGVDTARPYPPSDAADRGRCIRLLRLIPEWIPRLNELAGKPVTESLVFSSSGMHTERNGWSAQIPLIMMEGRL